MTDADAHPLPFRGCRYPVDALSRYPAGGALAEHARTRGARYGRLRVRAGADDREQDFQSALPDAAGASASVAAAALIDPLPPKQTKEKTMIHPSTFLNRALLADAIFSGAAALALTL